MTEIVIVHNIPIHYKHLLFTELERRGLSFHVLFLASGSSERHEEIDLLHAAYENSVAWQGTYETAPAWTRASFVWRELSRLSPRLVIISGYYAAECWVAWLWAKLHVRPIILWNENNYFDRPRTFWKELPKRIFCKGVRRAHVYGASNRDYLIRLGVPAKDIDSKRAVVNVGRFLCPAAPRIETNSAQGEFTLLFVGRLAPEKNLGFLLRAFALGTREGRAREMRLVLAGRGPLEDALRQEARRLGIETRVDFTGYIAQKDLPSLYHSADFFVLPSTSETWGLVAAEAMLAGLPILISTQCGCAADLVNESTGWTFSPYNLEELAGLISNLPALDREKRAAIKDAAIALASQYSPRNAAEAVLQSIRSALGGTETAARNLL